MERGGEADGEGWGGRWRGVGVRWREIAVGVGLQALLYSTDTLTQPAAYIWVRVPLQATKSQDLAIIKRRILETYGDFNLFNRAVFKAFKAAF